jgi:hypothetical protein
VVTWELRKLWNNITATPSANVGMGMNETEVFGEYRD